MNIFYTIDTKDQIHTVQSTKQPCKLLITEGGNSQCVKHKFTSTFVGKLTRVDVFTIWAPTDKHYVHNKKASKLTGLDLYGPVIFAFPNDKEYTTIPHHLYIWLFSKSNEPYVLTTLKTERVKPIKIARTRNHKQTQLREGSEILQK